MGIDAGLQPVLHVALCVVAPAQLVSLRRHHLVCQVLQQVVQQARVSCIGSDMMSGHQCLSCSGSHVLAVLYQVVKADLSAWMLCKFLEPCS